jgi:hypothetical protein
MSIIERPHLLRRNKMKGIIFKQFLTLVEKEFGEDLVEEMIDHSKVPSGGSYTSVGTYPHEEIIKLAETLSKKTNTNVNVLLKQFSSHLALYFLHTHGKYFKNTDLFTFLESINNHIHKEVKKLYPEAELPEISTKRQGQSLILEYSSSRPFADLAEGLIESTTEYFDEDISMTVLESSVDGKYRVFKIENKGLSNE